MSCCNVDISTEEDGKDHELQYRKRYELLQRINWYSIFTTFLLQYRKRYELLQQKYKK